MSNIIYMAKKTNKIKKEYIDIAKRYSKVLEKNGIKVTSILFFGSRIKGNPHTESDLDTCVISPSFGHDRHGERVLLMNLREGISDLIEPHPFSPSEFDDIWNPLAQRIKKTGIKVL